MRLNASFNIGDTQDARASLNDESPDALIVDIRLGEHNGLQLVHIARRSRPDLVVVVVSDFDDPVLREEAAMAQAVYLLKPIELPRLKGNTFQYLSPTR